MRKDIERCFGVFVKNFGALKDKLCGWYVEDLKQMFYCCVILHNMTIEVRREEYIFSDEVEWSDDAPGSEDNAVQSIFLEEGNQVDEASEEVLAQRVAHMCTSVEDATKHVELREDLMGHIWRRN